MDFDVSVLKSVVLALDDSIDAIADDGAGLVGLKLGVDGITGSSGDDNCPG